MNAEYLSMLSNRNYDNDFERVFIEKNRILLRLYKMCPSTKFALFLLKLECSQYCLLRRSFPSMQTYQPVLNSIISDIEKTMSELDLPVVNLTGCADVNGFNVFNAESFPCFGENYIAINSGIFFFSHVFARTIQPFLSKEDSKGHFPSFLYYYLSQCFVKVAIGYLTRDRTKSFLPIRFIPEDDSLLSGIETFVCAHEYAHLCFRDNSQMLKNLSWNKFSSSLKKLIMSNEEIAADAFAVVVLSHMQSRVDSGSYLLFAPCCLFQLLSQFDDMIGKIENPRAPHPSNEVRYRYIQQMIVELLPDNRYEKWEEAIGNLCCKLRPRILKKYNHIQKVYEEMSAVYLSYHTQEFYDLFLKK